MATLRIWDICEKFKEYLKSKGYKIKQEKDLSIIYNYKFGEYKGIIGLAAEYKEKGTWKTL